MDPLGWGTGGGGVQEYQRRGNSTCRYIMSKSVKPTIDDIIRQSTKYSPYALPPTVLRELARILGTMNKPETAETGCGASTLVFSQFSRRQPHNSNGPIGTIASLHVDASIPNCIIQEFFYPYLDHYNEILTEPIEYADGYLKIPDRPGLGTDINEEAILKRPPIDTPPEASWIGSYW